MPAAVSPIKKASMTEQSSKRLLVAPEPSSRRAQSPTFEKQSARSRMPSGAPDVKQLRRRGSTMRLDDIQAADVVRSKPSFIRDEASGKIRGTVFKMVKSSSGAIKWREREASLMLGSGLLTLSPPNSKANVGVMVRHTVGKLVDSAADFLTASAVTDSIPGGLSGQTATANSNTIITAKQINHEEHPWIMELRFSPDSSNAERNRSSETVMVLAMKDGEGRDQWVSCFRQIISDKEHLLDKYLQYYTKEKAKEFDQFEATKLEIPESSESETSDADGPASAEASTKPQRNGHETSEELSEMWHLLLKAVEAEGVLQPATLRQILQDSGGVNLHLDDAAILRDELQKSPGRLDLGVFRRAVSRLPLASTLPGAQGSAANAKKEATMQAKMSLEAFRDEKMSDQEWGDFLAGEVEKAKFELQIPVMHGPLDHPSRYLDHGIQDDSEHEEWPGMEYHDEQTAEPSEGYAGARQSDESGGHWQRNDRSEMRAQSERDAEDDADEAWDYEQEFDSDSEDDTDKLPQSIQPPARPPSRPHPDSGMRSESEVSTHAASRTRSAGRGTGSASPGSQADVSRVHGAYYPTHGALSVAPSLSQTLRLSASAGGSSSLARRGWRHETRTAPAPAPSQGVFRKTVSRALVDLYIKFPATGQFLEEHKDDPSSELLLTKRLPTIIDTRANIRRSMTPLLSDNKDYLFLTPALLPRPQPQLGRKSPGMSQRFNATVEAISRTRAIQASNAPLGSTFRMH